MKGQDRGGCSKVSLRGCERPLAGKSKGRALPSQARYDEGMAKTHLPAMRLQAFNPYREEAIRVFLEKLRGEGILAKVDPVFSAFNRFQDEVEPAYRVVLVLGTFELVSLLRLHGSDESFELEVSSLLHMVDRYRELSKAFDTLGRGRYTFEVLKKTAELQKERIEETEKSLAPRQPGG